MSINDLKIDIITIISELSDHGILQQIRNDLQHKVVESKVNDFDWGDAKVEIRKGVTFEDLITEQDYKKISFDEFQASIGGEDWEVSLDDLLSHAN